jgi:hypothetical protein
MKTPNLTIVSIADQNYFWGLFLLGASVERWKLGDKLMMFHTGLDADSTRYLEQFSRVELRKMREGSPFRLHCRKPEAMLQADGEYVAWLDSDCLAIGDLNEDMIPANGEMQARMRTPRETIADLGRFYQKGERPGGLPKLVLDTWREDVGERKIAKIDAMVPSNVFVLHSKFMPFIEHWERQMRKVLNPECGTLDSKNPAYYLTDESVLNSLLAFAEFSPNVAEYKLAAARNRHIAHFISSPKPWVHWLPRNLYCLPFVLETIEWAKANGKEVPPLPPSLQATRKTRSILEAHLFARLKRARTVSRKVLARMPLFMPLPGKF